MVRRYSILIIAFSLLVGGTLLTITPPAYAEGVSYQYKSTGDLRLGYWDTDGPVTWPDITLFGHESEGFRELCLGGGYSWTINNYLKCSAEAYLSVQNGGKYSLLLWAQPVITGAFGGSDIGWVIKLPAMQYLGDCKDTLFVRDKAYITMDGFQIGMILKGFLNEGKLIEDHGPYLGLPLGDTTSLEVGWYDGTKNLLECRMIITID